MEILVFILITLIIILYNNCFYAIHPEKITKSLFRERVLITDPCIAGTGLHLFTRNLIKTNPLLLCKFCSKV